jgi:DNA mismatch endonuclease (patch repair protein)
MPKSRLDYWGQKISRNKERDATNLRRLRGMSWKCLVLWECQLLKQDALSERIRRFIDE